MNEIGLATFITIQITRFLFFQNVMVCLSYTADKCLFKVKSRNTILICRLWSRSRINTPKWCHAAFTFSSEHIQQINQIFLLLTLNMYLSVGHRIKSTKQLKCTLNNGVVVSLKHVHETSISQHGLYSHWALSRRRLSLLKILWGPEGERRIWGPGTG